MKSGHFTKVLIIFLALFFSNTGEIEAKVGGYCCAYTETVMQSIFGITEIKGFATVGPVITIPSSGTGPEGGLAAPQDINTCEANCRAEVLGLGFGICHNDYSYGWYESGTLRGFWQGTYSLCLEFPLVGDITVARNSYFKFFSGSMCNGCCNP